MKDGGSIDMPTSNPPHDPRGPASDERQAVLAAVRRFVEEKVRRSARRLDHADEYPTELVEEMARLGLFGMGVPTAYGGLGLDTETYARVFEELSRGWMSLSGVLGTHGIACYLIASFGSERQRQALLGRLAEGSLRAGLALTEPSGGSDVASLRTSARPAPEGYTLSGEKQFITNTHHGSAFVVLARTGGPGAGGLSAFFVEKAKVRGLVEGQPLKKLGYRGLVTSSITFEDCHVEADALIGEVPGHGFAQVMSGLELGRINVAARAVGVAQAALDDSLSYARGRVTFGRPIVEHQAIAHKLADMATDIEAGRLLYLSAARKKDAGERADLEAGMAKLFASTMCARATLEAIQIHGGYGYTEEFDVERYYRDAPLFTVGEGTNEILRTLIARGLVRLKET
jgi:alkylation response protein AidB-like acyl-CoA dehydrogenase